VDAERAALESANAELRAAQAEQEPPTPASSAQTHTGVETVRIAREWHFSLTCLFSHLMHRACMTHSNRLRVLSSWWKRTR
jgi:hypothetical protein